LKNKLLLIKLVLCIFWLVQHMLRVIWVSEINRFKSMRFFLKLSLSRPTTITAARRRITSTGSQVWSWKLTVLEEMGAG